MASSSRQRKRKAGLMRIDAAFDSLCPMGFSRVLVRKTVNRLLKAYGGDQGWVFLEEASYKAVIDAILEEQELQEKAELENAQPKLLEGSSIKAEAVTQSHSPDAQSVQDDSGCIKQSILSDVTEHSQTSHAKVTAEVLSLAQHIKSEAPMDNNSQLPLEDIVEYKATTTENCRALTVAGVESPVMSLRPSMELGSSPVVKRRRPCFGWISEDDKDESDLVYLMPAPSNVLKF
ncbi:hypothetical protein QN277_015785 [Acacia crassicarpa]|uniref:WIYLD domain-containing protein n=1 Tax=Acacia crassicarpa TaxID=499986 RepID=A0AAE1MU94_9FABA|nr:hypothetical protein QN277_015785 [Acacia crassicarpa]